MNIKTTDEENFLRKHWTIPDNPLLRAAYLFWTHKSNNEHNDEKPADAAVSSPRSTGIFQIIDAGMGFRQKTTIKFVNSSADTYSFTALASESSADNRWLRNCHK